MIRVRIAPSPTGYLHLGNARTAIFNWLYAKNKDGMFIVRIDDTDTERSTKDFEKDILDNLKWLGLEWDEGIDVGGPHGSYRQSERFGRYKQVAEELVEKGLAYIDDGAIKFRVEKEGQVAFTDLVRGEMIFNKNDIEDFVIMRSNGSPTYHLASTVDDIDYEISHVARGEDILPSTPKHILITESLSKPLPEYCHLPLLFGPDGKRLSKRHGATSVKEYKNKGLLSEALFNYMCLLGWSPEKDVEVFSHDYAISKFNFKDVLPSSAIFDENKLMWMNGLYIRELKQDLFLSTCINELSLKVNRNLYDTEKERLKILLPSIQERMESLNDILPLVSFVLDEKFIVSEDHWKDVFSVNTEQYLIEVKEALINIDTFEEGLIEKKMRDLLEKCGIKAKEGFQSVRVAVTGSKISPPLFTSMFALGRGACLARIEERIEILQSNN